MKKILRILAIIVLVLIVAFLGLRTYTKSKSPESTIIENGPISAKVTYCQPYKKGRVVFGELVPFGKVWRTGANEATRITFDQDVHIAGKPLPKGDYTLWTIPGSDGWTAIFNKQTGQWGTNYDETQDVLRVPIVSRTHTPMTEQFTMKFAPNMNGSDLVLFWDETEAIIPISK